jgi:hypothetical protein
MQNVSVTAPQIRTPPWLPLLFLAGASTALVGGYWDDAFHTEVGRDTFLSRPHLAIYLGVAAVGAGLAVWLAVSARAVGWRAAQADPLLRLAALSVLVTLASGPIDDGWHRAFGRDAVLWSPPHVLGIVGTGCLALALLAQLARDERVWPQATRAAVGGLALAAFAFLVVEYDTDVPQFAPLWYLPVLALGSAFVLGAVRRLDPHPRAASLTALAHLAFVGATSLVLVALGYDTPVLPLVVVSAVALEAAARRWSSPVVLGIAFATTLYVAYVPVLAWLEPGVTLSLTDVVLGLPLAAAAAALALAAFASRTPVARAPAALGIVTVVLCMLVVAPRALAHDPGQGPDAGRVALSAAADGQTITLRVSVSPPCGRWSGERLVIRRAGQERAAPLSARTGCRFEGRVAAGASGRWFAYAELQRDGREVESWLPVVVGDGMRVSSDASRPVYRAPEAAAADTPQVAVGAGLYAGVLALLAAVVALLRRVARQHV